MTSFTDRLDVYIATRRRSGGEWHTAAKRLRPFVSFADSEGAEWITVDLFLRWKDAFGSPAAASASTSADAPSRSSNASWRSSAVSFSDLLP